jgi:long-chain acyl-CoA synthetase
MTEIACYKHAFIIVALYDTLGADAMEYIVNQTDMEYIVLSTDKLKNITKIKNQLPTIKTVIVMESTLDDANRDLAKEAGLNIYTFTEVEELGSKVTEEPQLATPEDISTICYTR